MARLVIDRALNGRLRIMPRWEEMIGIGAAADLRERQERFRGAEVRGRPAAGSAKDRDEMTSAPYLLPVPHPRRKEWHLIEKHALARSRAAGRVVQTHAQGSATLATGPLSVFASVFPFSGKTKRA